MNAPPIELLIRAANATMATFAFVLLLRGWVNPRMPAMPLMRFLTVVVGMQMVWRWFVLWLGVQSDLGHFGWFIEWVQPLTASLLFLLLLAIALLAWFHLRRIYPVGDRRGGTDG